jgi:flavin reductase (DIM6/NTAB) family NADH-FMN oxidoreductase RutF
MKELKPEELKDNPFVLIGKEWMLITAQKESKVNTMTASWGGMGILWDREVAIIVVRSGRFTKEFVDSAETFSLTFFDDSYKKTLGYLGSVSGRDEDKIAKSGLIVKHINQTPYFEEGRMVMICKRLFAQKMSPDAFQIAGLDEKFYPEKDYHTMYIAEIEQILTKD